MASRASKPQKNLLTRTSEQPNWFMALLFFNSLLLLWNAIYGIVSHA